MSYEPTDQELVIRLKSGDLTALAALDQRYRVRMVRLIAQIAKSYEEAEDIYQEAIFKVVSHIDSFDHQRSFHNWLHRVAKNQCIDNYRRKRHVEVDGDDEFLLKVPSGGRDPLNEATDRELQEEIQKAIGALPKRQRSVAELRLLEGLGYKEIANRIGGSVQAVKSLFSVARKSLQVKLQFYLSCFAFPWRRLRQRLDGLSISTSTATSVSGIISVTAHLTVVAALIYGSMDGNRDNASIASPSISVAITTNPADIRRSLPVGEYSSRETTAKLSLSSSRKRLQRETPTPENRAMEAVLPPRMSTVLGSPAHSLTSIGTGFALHKSMPTAKPISSSKTLVVPQVGLPLIQHSVNSIISRPSLHNRSNRVITRNLAPLDLPDESYEHQRDSVHGKPHPMQAPSQSVSNAFRRLRAIRSVQEFEANSLAQLRRAARSVGQYPLLISRCDQADLHRLLAKRWTPIVMLRSVVGGTHPWVITSWETETEQITLTNPFERHTKQLNQTAFIEAWQGGSSPSTCLLLATRPVPDPSLVFPSSQKHVSALSDNSPRIWH